MRERREEAREVSKEVCVLEEEAAAVAAVVLYSRLLRQ